MDITIAVLKSVYMINRDVIFIYRQTITEEPICARS